MKFQPIEILQTVSFTLFDWLPWLLNLCLLIKLHSYSIFAKILEAGVSISRWWCRGSLAGCVFRVWIYHSQESLKSSYLVAQWLCLIWFVVIEAMVLCTFSLGVVFLLWVQVLTLKGSLPFIDKDHGSPRSWGKRWSCLLWQDLWLYQEYIWWAIGEHVWLDQSSASDQQS